MSLKEVTEDKREIEVIISELDRLSVSSGNVDSRVDRLRSSLTGEGRETMEKGQDDKPEAGYITTINNLVGQISRNLERTHQTLNSLESIA